METPNGPRALRIGDTERIAAANALGEHFAAGRLDQSELDERLGRAYAARTFDDLEPLFHDLPEPRPTRPAIAGAPPPFQPTAAPTWSSTNSRYADATGGTGPAGAPGATGRPVAWPPPWWPGARWAAARPAWRRAPAPVQVLVAVFGVLMVLAVLSALAVLLPLLILAGLVAWAVQGGPRRRRWNRHQPVGRAPWGGDNQAWYQFGWSSKGWPDGRPGPGVRGGFHPGRSHHHRHHGRRRRG